MVLERCILIEGQAYQVTISDERKALSDAKASGRAILGVWGQDFSDGYCPASYMIEEVSQVNDRLLERVVRRRLGFPWIIAETPWIVIREFTGEDAVVIKRWNEPEGLEVDFGDETTMTSYLQNQYPFYEYGIWAVVLKDNGRLIGMAGISNFETQGGETVLELGYYICSPYRKKGYAKEACHAVMEYAAEELDIQNLYIRIDASNEASIHLAVSLGFQVIQTNSESGQCWNLYAWNCP